MGGGQGTHAHGAGKQAMLSLPLGGGALVQGHAYIFGIVILERQRWPAGKLGVIGTEFGIVFKNISVSKN